MNIFGVIVLLFVGCCNADIVWSTSGIYAVSSAKSTGETTLLPGNTGTQFLYTKTTGTASTPIVTVSLINAELKLSVALQQGFDMVNQKCSCYYIDSAELAAKFSGIKSSRSYRLQFSGAGVDLTSGFFTIKIDASTAVLPEPVGSVTPAPPSTGGKTPEGGSSSGGGLTIITTPESELPADTPEKEVPKQKQATSGGYKLLLDKMGLFGALITFIVA